MNTNKTSIQISIAIVTNIFQEIFEEQKLLQEKLCKAHKEPITSIISSNTTITSQRLEKLSKKLDKNIKKLINIETESKEITKGIDACADIIDDKIKNMNQKINKLEKYIKHANKEIEKKDKEMPNLLDSRRWKPKI